MTDLEEKIEEIKEAVEEKVEEIKEAVEDKVEEVTGKDLGEVVDGVKDKAEDVVEAVKGKAEDVVEAAKEKAEDVAEAAKDKAGDVIEAVKEKAEEITGKDLNGDGVIGKAVSEPAKVESMEDYKEDLEKSLKQGPPKNDDPVWDKFEQLLADKTVFQVKVDSAVKGGVIAFVDEVRAFIPASKLAAAFVENLEEYKGKNIDVTVITADREGKKLVLSGRDAARAKQREERAAAQAAAQAAITEGAELEGKVDSLKDYGAFIDLGNGVTGLLHVSQISYKRVEKPADVLKEGETVKVKVIGNKDGKISLSMKALEEAPKRAPREDRPEREDRPRRDKNEKIEHIDGGKATTSMADLLSGLKF